MQFDLLIKGGEVVDDAPGLSGRRDVAVIGDRIVALQGVGEKDSGALLGLVEREQWSMLADGFPPRSARLPVSILDYVTFDVRRLHPDTEAGQGGIPDDIILSTRGKFVDGSLR